MKINDFTEDSPYAMFKRWASKTSQPRQYEKAAQTLHNVLVKKSRDGNINHSLGYYAQQIGKSFAGIDYRALVDYYKEHYGSEGIIDESRDYDNYEGFCAYCCDKLGIRTIPKISIVDKNLDGAFGHYNIQDKCLTVSSKNRHRADVMRTLAHELVHLAQHERGRELDGATGSSDENQANSIAGILMRNWADKDPALFEFKIEKPDPEDTMGIKRNQMPQVATKDYPEFLDYLKDNGATFSKDTVPADSLKAIQGEFSDHGVEKALKLRKIEKPLIASSDNYIIDGHHRWLAALNTGVDVNIFRVDIPGKQLLQLVKDFPKTTYKDIYTERLVKVDPKGPKNLKKPVNISKYAKRKAMMQAPDDLQEEANDSLVDKFLKATGGKYGKRDMCGPACLDFIDWAKQQGIELKRVRGEFVADEVVSAKADFTPEMKKEFAQSGLDWNSAADRKAWIEQSEYAEEWKRVPHYWTVDKDGNIHDPSGYQQLVKTGLAKDLDPSRYIPQGVTEELTVKQSHIFKVVSNLADRKDNRPFPIKFYDGGTLEVQPSTAKRIIDFYYQANDALQTKLLKFLPTYNGFKEIAKAAGAVQESAGVGKITKQNSTPDVKPGETERQAKKFFGGNGKPKPLGVKGATPHQAFNLGMTENMSVTGTERGKTARKKKLRPGSEEWFKHWFSLPLMKREDLELAKTEMLEYAKQYMQEGYRLQLERGTDMDVLHIVDTKSGKRTEVRGKTGYESGNYDPEDRLHKLLDKIGKAANISELINGEPVGINPNHPDGASAKKDTDVAFNESTDLDSLRKFVRSQREAPDQVLYQMMMAPDTYGHEASNFVRSWYEKTKEENGLNDVDSALEIMVDELGLKSVQENFKDGKDYMHGYCHVWALKDIQKHPERKIYARVGYHYDDDSEEVDHIFTVDTETGKAYDVRGEFNSIDALLADYEYGADEVDVQEITRADIDDLCRSGELKPLDENFKDGKKPGRKGLSKRMGVDCSKPVGELRKIAKNSSGEKQRMAHWCANMKSGRK